MLYTRNLLFIHSIYMILIVSGTFLVIQWLRLQAPNVGGQVLSLVRELDPTCCNQKGHMPGPSEGKYLKKKKKEQQKHQQASLF